jgi:hypothetical protein
MPGNVALDTIRWDRKIKSTTKGFVGAEQARRPYCNKLECVSDVLCKIALLVVKGPRRT